MIHPICDKCNKPVDKITVWEDPVSCCTLVKLKCHGEFESFAVSEENFIEYDKIEIVKAFVGRKAINVLSY